MNRSCVTSRQRTSDSLRKELRIEKIVSGGTIKLPSRWQHQLVKERAGVVTRYMERTAPLDLLAPPPPPPGVGLLSRVAGQGSPGRGSNGQFARGSSGGNYRKSSPGDWQERTPGPPPSPSS